MSRGRPPSHPSPRNLEIYHLFVCEGCPQSQIAVQFNLSQPRIAHVCRQVQAWIENLLPSASTSRLPIAPGQTPAGQRLHLAIALRRQQLTGASQKFLNHFGGQSGAAAYEQLLAAHDAGLLPDELADRLPPRDLVQSAARLARELQDLASLAARGPFLELPSAS